MEGEWSCCRAGQFNGGRMVVIEVVTNGGRMVMLQRWKSLMEGEWFCDRGGLFKGGGLFKLERWLV